MHNWLHAFICLRSKIAPNKLGARKCVLIYLFTYLLVFTTPLSARTMNDANGQYLYRPQLSCIIYLGLNSIIGKVNAWMRMETYRSNCLCEWKISLSSSIVMPYLLRTKFHHRTLGKSWVFSATSRQFLNQGL
jgi:hypothetical protein